MRLLAGRLIKAWRPCLKVPKISNDSTHIQV